MMMHGWRQSPSTSTIISWYASLTTMVMIARTAVHDLVPLSVQRYVEALVHHYIFRPRPKGLTLIFDATTGYTRNEIFDAVEAYLSTKPDNKTDCLNVTKSSTNKNLLFSFNNNEVIQEEFQGVQLTWRFYRGSSESESPAKSSSFHLSFPKEHKDLIIGSYIPFVLEKHKMMTQEERVLKIHTLDTKHNYHHVGPWNSVNLDHPATFDTLAMEPSEKEAIIQDLDRFRSRKGFYRRVGRAWKRGYLLYGPPGTGKSSLIGDMANYLKFDVYDLQLASVHDDCDLRRVLLATGNRSILVIEDIDCGAELPDRNKKTAAVRSGKSAAVQGSAVYSHDGFTYRPTITLSGLLNFIDGLWSSCGDERIIVFTTNHKEKLEPALLRPGRMDMHIHMSYCTDQGFKVLANNYLGESAATHTLSPQISALIRDANATPAQLAEELMKSDDPDVALAKVLNLLHRKIAEAAATAKAQVDKDKDLMEVRDDNNNAEQLVENKQQTNGWK